MTPNEFVMWFKGFSEACHHLNPTPQQWEKILEKLKEVKPESKSFTCSGNTITYMYTGNPLQGYSSTYVTKASGTHMTPGSNQLLND